LSLRRRGIGHQGAPTRRSFVPHDSEKTAVEMKARREAPSLR
jgi:hypothetical protein